MNHLRFFLSEAWEYLVRGRATSLAALVALVAVLFLFGLVLLVTHNVRALTEEIQTRKGLTVFFTEGTSEARARELASVFEGFGEVAGAEFVDREQALADLEKDLGDFPIGTTLGDNPLPHSLILQLSPEAAGRSGALRELAHELLAYDDVEDVVYGDEWVDALDRNLHLVRVATMSVGSFAALAVGVVLLTTLRLLFVGRRDTLRILKVVGASDEFLRTPFLFLGGLQCLMAAVVALLLLHATRFFFDAFFPGVQQLPGGWQLGFLLICTGLGALASYVAIEPSLRRLEKLDDEVVR
ncbi:MAG: permease-like cell division protein FtsX [Candidatus Eisenbacteria bacterium]|uniref:Cell division protein FtsX n=1 Tax=Eiseniibacteriota bacterium TaxID=2212470 RepID=A0A956RNZ1_UNCEI|nr:permease-like cell division protein FtsX [Candidatus Eisenbacteria bacterium]